MPSIVICEKPSQARNIRAAVGDRFGPVLPAAGHIVRLKLPEEQNPEWAKWSTALLHPGTLYGKVPQKEKHAREALERIRSALRGVDRVVVATDCDREGQVIGQEILEYLGYRGRVDRAIFTAEDPKTLQTAFSQLRPNADYAGMYASGVAREQADQITNLSLTRAATVTLRPPGQKGAIGIGRVKTPTLAIVCRRELEILNFVPRDYYEIRADVATSVGQIPLTCTRMPSTYDRTSGGALANSADLEDDSQAGDEVDGEGLPDALQDPLVGKIVDRSLAERVADASRSYSGPLAVAQTDKTQSPPKLYHLPALQSAASARFGWTASKTLQIAQALYERHQVLTYPRAEARHLPENAIADAGPLAQALTALPDYSQHRPLVEKPTIRSGKSGHFSDKALAGVSHHAIVPNVNVAGRLRAAVAALDADERALFDLVARSYLAALAPDYRYRQTTMSIDVPHESHSWRFQTTGSVPKSLGWRAIIGRPADDAPDLPPATNGEPVTVREASVQGKNTKPPPRYTEGSLIIAMEQAWRFVTDPQQRAVLKDAKGIGTPATRDSIIAGMFKQRQLERKAKQIHPTEAGLALYQLINKTAPNIADPGRTALWETLFTAVERRKLDPEEAIRKLSDEAKRAIDRLVATARETGAQIAGGPSRRPSEKMVKYADLVASRTGNKLEATTRRDYSKLKAWIEANAPSGGADGERAPFPPSSKQLQLAEDLARKVGCELPEAVRTNSKLLSNWIDQTRTQNPSPPSQKQIEYAEHLAEQSNQSLPDEARADARAMSAWIDQNKKPGNPAGGRKRTQRRSAPSRQRT